PAELRYARGPERWRESNPNERWPRARARCQPPGGLGLTGPSTQPPSPLKENESSWIFEPRLTCSNTLRRVQSPGFSLVDARAAHAARRARSRAGRCDLGIRKVNAFGCTGSNPIRSGPAAARWWQRP